MFYLQVLPVVGAVNFESAVKLFNRIALSFLKTIASSIFTDCIMFLFVMTGETV